MVEIKHIQVRWAMSDLQKQRMVHQVAGGAPDQPSVCTILKASVSMPTYVSRNKERYMYVTTKTDLEFRTQHRQIAEQYLNAL